MKNNPFAIMVAAAMFGLVGCGAVPNDPNSKYGGQRVPGDWQTPLLKGCSAELKMRLPVALLDVIQDWRLKSGDQPCPQGTTSIAGSIEDFMPWVSPGTREKLAALNALALRREAEMQRKYPEMELHDWNGHGRMCRELDIRISPNHRYQGVYLVARGSSPPQAGNTYTFRVPQLLPNGLSTMGEIWFRRSDAASPDDVREPYWTRGGLFQYWWQAPGRSAGSVWFHCSSLRRTTDVGGCRVTKDHSEAAYLHYAMCSSLLPEWRQFDDAMRAIADDFIVSERLVKFQRAADDPTTDDLGRFN